MKKHLMTAAMATGLILTAFGASASADGNTYTVQSGDSLWKISQNNHVTVDQLKTWNQLSSDTIYVNQNLLIVPPASSAQAPAVTTKATVSYTVKAGDTLYAIAKTFGTTIADLKSINGLTSDLIQIGQQLKISNGATTTPPLVTVPLVSKAQAVIDEAKKYIGVPYVWGGSTPAGFDCSGLVNYVFNKEGVAVPRTVATLWAAEKPVSAPILGDLVFFDINQTGTPTHVGIYIGDNKFIHAGSNGVTISDLTLTYWKTRYLGAKTAL
ncbi:MAG: LysM peptidoglycan-binding domain-containing protein [Bacillota bacterium]|nr:LysM peptidoglycan-binding domain-containing protein [Bacillota bacterium]MDP4155291.1 LysM peptidoglycan-binding domain-containing protein [Bacillota bacterium]